MKKIESTFYEKEADENNYINFIKVMCKDTIATSAHFHDSLELVILTKGKCNIHINGEKVDLKEGDAAFIDRFDVHYYDYFPESEYYVLLVSRKYLDDINGFDKCALTMFLPKCEKYNQIISLFDDAYALWENSNIAFKRGFANLALGIMTKEYTTIVRRDKGDAKRFADILIYINQHFNENITLEFLSDKFGYSKNYFSTLFNKTAGMNLREYINRRRICEFECIKTDGNNLPIYAIAQHCGFDNMKTFYRVYNKYVEKP